MKDETKSNKGLIFCVRNFYMNNFEIKAPFILVVVLDAFSLIMFHFGQSIAKKMQKNNKNLT